LPSFLLSFSPPPQSFALFHFIVTHVVSIKNVTGESMLPELSASGDWIIANHLPAHYPKLFSFQSSSSPSSSSSSPWSRGDIVFFHHPFLPSRLVGKRIIGMPGDTVEVNPGVVRPWVDDVDEAGKWKGKGREGVQQRYIKVPPGHIWAQGDNLSNSTDSRDYGPVPMALLQGKFVARVGCSHSKLDTQDICLMNDLLTPLACVLIVLAAQVAPNVSLQPSLAG
jgi:inner membrane protease subunit 1